MNTLTCYAKVYSYALDKVILPEGQFYIYGFSHQALSVAGLSKATLRDLSGEAMALPSIGKFVFATALNLEVPGLVVQLHPWSGAGVE